MASQPWCEGIPEPLRRLVSFFPYGDIDALRSLFARHGDRIAAVVMEPTSTELPRPDYLRAVRELTLDHDTVLVFDEVMTAFRIARGGGQEAFDVVPDLACLGKSMANGFALSALVGKRDVMEVIPRVGHGTTFRGETTALAAAKACLTIVRDEPVVEHIARVGSTVRTRFREACVRAGVDAELVGPEARMTMRFAQAGRIRPIGLQTLLIQECLKQGVFMNGLILPCYAHDDRAIDQTMRAVEHGLGAVARAIDRNSVEGLLHIPAVRFFHGDGGVEDPAPPGAAP